MNVEITDICQMLSASLVASRSAEGAMNPQNYLWQLVLAAYDQVLSKVIIHKTGR